MGFRDGPRRGGRFNEPPPEAPVDSGPKLSTSALTHEWGAFAAKSGGYHWGTGRRKTSIARVRIRRGNGVFEVNGKKFDDFFKLDSDRRAVTSPLDSTDTRKRVDVFVNVSGGGTTGQAGAIILGVARALLKANKEYQPFLREGGYLTRDPREVERKKYGKAGARRSFQFSKR